MCFFWYKEVNKKKQNKLNKTIKTKQRDWEWETALAENSVLLGNGARKELDGYAGNPKRRVWCSTTTVFPQYETKVKSNQEEEEITLEIVGGWHWQGALPVPTTNVEPAHKSNTLLCPQQNSEVVNLTVLIENKGLEAQCGKRFLLVVNGKEQGIAVVCIIRVKKGPRSTVH